MNKSSDSKFVIRNWNIVNDQTNPNSDVGNEITYNTEVLKSNLCNYKDVYILVKGDFTVVAVYGTQVAFRNCAPFTKCISKNDRTTIDDAKDLN